MDTLQMERVRTTPSPTTPTSGGPSPRMTILVVAIVVLAVGGVMGYLLGRGVQPMKTETTTPVTQTVAPPNAVGQAAQSQAAPSETGVPTTKSVTLTKEADEAAAAARGELYTPLFAEGRVAHYGSLV